MGQQRYTGRLKNWNADRGFGFIAADEGGQDIFVHITSFQRKGVLPVVGEALSFQVEPDLSGKRSAVQVLRPTDINPVSTRRFSRTKFPAVDNGPSFLAKLFSVFLICALAYYGYVQYSKRAAKYDSALPALPVNISPGKLQVPPDFKCDGRSVCSQMTSCREATLFLQNCPGMNMDGNGDGVPCEQQWCSK